MGLVIGRSMSILEGPSPKNWKEGVAEFTILAKDKKVLLRVDISHILKSSKKPDVDTFIGLVVGSSNLVVSGAYNPMISKRFKGSLILKLG